MRRIVWNLAAVTIVAAGAVTAVVFVSDSNGDHRAGMPNKRPATASSSADTAATMTPADHAGALCRTAFGAAVVEAAPTTAGAVRESGIGVVGDRFRSAFRGVANDSFATWCMIRTSADCYDESAVAADGSQVHIAHCRLRIALRSSTRRPRDLDVLTPQTAW